MAGLLSGVLPFVFSQGDRAKRYMNGLLADPIGTMQQTAGGIVDAGREQQGLLGRAFADPAKPFQITDSGALNQAVGNVMAGPMGFAPAGIVGPWHGDVLQSISKGLSDDVVDAAFGANGYVYHTPLRPFENAQQTAIGTKAQPLAERVFSTSTPLSAKTLNGIEAVPVSESATGAFAKELSDEGATAFLHKDRSRFSVVTPSAKNEGQFQATQYDPKGAIGDSQHATSADAIQRLIDSGYARILDQQRAESLLRRVMLGN